MKHKFIIALFISLGFFSNNLWAQEEKKIVGDFSCMLNDNLICYEEIEDGENPIYRMILFNITSNEYKVIEDTIKDFNSVAVVSDSNLLYVSEEGLKLYNIYTSEKEIFLKNINEDFIYNNVCYNKETNIILSSKVDYNTYKLNINLINSISKKTIKEFEIPLIEQEMEGSTPKIYSYKHSFVIHSLNNIYVIDIDNKKLISF